MQAKAKAQKQEKAKAMADAVAMDKAEVRSHCNFEANHPLLPNGSELTFRIA